jgi:hypothetical protein
VEVGLGGNIFAKSFGTFQDLAALGFFWNLWELLERYGINFCLRADFDNPLLRERDRTLMDAVSETGIFSKQDIISINFTHHHKGIHSVGDMTYSDRMLIDPIMFMQGSGTSNRDFPLQRPTGSDHITWLKAIGSLTQAGRKLHHPLGKYTGRPHRPDDWFVSSNLSQLYHKVTGGHKVYNQEHLAWATRFGAMYHYHHLDDTTCPDQRRASVSNWTGLTVQFHSLALSWIPGSVQVPNTLLSTLALWDNQSLWKHLRIDGGNGGWIHNGLMQGSLVIGHDGSYMPHLANNICACAVVIHCTRTDQYAEMTWAEKSTKLLANNYQAEILGGIGAQLIIKAAVTGRSVAGHRLPRVGCDNMGVVRHSNSPLRPMLEKQPQADVLRYFKGLMALSRIGGMMEHVYGHSDEYLSETEMTQ